MKKALIVATVGRFICSFEKNDIALLKNLGYEVFIACDVEDRKDELEQLGCKIVHLPIARNPFKKQNVTSYHQLKVLIQKEKFELIHCHTPVGGVLARMAGRKQRRTGTKIIYTAHGFHFFKGAPIVNWLIYYPIERWLSRYTDVLITINREDYQRAKMFHAQKAEYVPGVGIDVKKFSPNNVGETDKETLRKEFGITSKDTVLLSVGELSTRKNQRVAIEAVAKMNNSSIKYLIVGQGPLKKTYQELIEKYHLERNVILTGQRRDIKELCSIADVYVFPSLQEGLPVALMEAMASGLPVVCSNIRGNIDLIQDNKGGYLVQATDIDAFADGISSLIQDSDKMKEMEAYNIRMISRFSLEKVEEKMKKIYLSVKK